MRPLSFNDVLMLFVAIPLILSWLAFACYVIYMGINDSSGYIQQHLDFYTALIAIIGGPALLFINSILELWKAEQTPEHKRIEHDQSMARYSAKNGKEEA